MYRHGGGGLDFYRSIFNQKYIRCHRFITKFIIIMIQKNCTKSDTGVWGFSYKDTEKPLWKNSHTVDVIAANMIAADVIVGEVIDVIAAAQYTFNSMKTLLSAFK